MYKRGDLKRVVPSCPDAIANGEGLWCGGMREDGTFGPPCGECHYITDARSETSGLLKGDLAYLPYSCDEWVIGGREEIQALQDDLAAVLAEWDSRAPSKP